MPEQSPQMSARENSELEQIMVEYLLEKVRIEKGMSLDDVASKVYGSDNIAQSRLKLYRLRKPKKDGTVKKLTLEDYVLICQALGVDPVRILALNMEKVTKKN